MVKSHKKKSKKAHKAHKSHGSGESQSQGRQEPHSKTGASKSHHDTHKRKRSTRANDSFMWKTISIILAVFLIASIATGGFGMSATGNSIQNSADSITDQLSEKGIITPEQAQQTNDLIVEALTASDGKDSSQKGNEPVGDKLSVELYAMSQCPYGVQAEDAIIPAVKDLGEENFDLQIEYIATDNGDGTFQSLHGQPEVEGNIVQLCAGEHAPEKHLEFIQCMNENQDNIPDNWKSCAQDLNMPIDNIKSCYEGEKGKELLRTSLEKAQDADASASPTIFINGEEYNGGREELDFKRAFCSEFGENKPDACADIPEAIKFEMTVVNADDCENCNPEQIVATTKQLFPGVEIREVKATSEEGEKLIQKYDLEKAPSYIFAPEVTGTEMWKDEQFQQSFKEHDDGSYRLLDQVTGATYHLDEEKRDEQEALLENYPEANLEALDYSGDKPRLDYFVMAFCPYGNPADEAASELHELFGDKVEIVPHYIISSAGDNIQSLHGEQEGNQGVRELCALEELGKEAYFDFTLTVNDKCSSDNADSCWTDAAEAAGVDANAIEQCYEENRLEYAEQQDSLIQSIKTERQGQLTSPSASPTFLINGETYSGDRDADSLKSALCSEFGDAPAECEETLETNGSAASQPTDAAC
ncbi:MAG: thioredoxin domain-containing protein [Candidatus Woesearchaeota archaeon]